MNYDMTPQVTGKEYYFYFMRPYEVFAGNRLKVDTGIMWSRLIGPNNDVV